MRPVADALLAQAPFPAAGRRPGAADRHQGGCFGRAFAAKPVEQSELVEVLGGVRRKFVADRVEAIKFAVRTFGLHGACARFSAAGFLLSTMLPQKFSRTRMYLTPDMPQPQKTSALYDCRTKQSPSVRIKCVK